MSGSWDSTLRIWDAELGTQVGGTLTGHTSGVHSVAYSPDGKHIVSGSYDNTLRIWDAELGTQVGGSLTGYSGPMSAEVELQNSVVVNITQNAWNSIKSCILKIQVPAEGDGWFKSKGEWSFALGSI